MLLSNFPRILEEKRLWGSWFIVVGYDGDQNVGEEGQKVEQEQKPRERSFIRELLPDRLPTTAQVAWAIRIAAVVVVVLLGVLLVLYLIGLRFGITLLDLLKVLAVPITVGAAVPLLNWLQKRRELEVENQRAQDEALQAYLDQMSDLLVPKEDQPSLYDKSTRDSLKVVARARTLTVLPRLNGDRNASVVQFLYESRLIDRCRRVLDLSGAHLSSATLMAVGLPDAHLSKTNLYRANLIAAYLYGADLSNADLSWARLSGANLHRATLWGALGVTEAQLDQAESLKGALMPNNQEYEDWLKVNKVITCETPKDEASSPPVRTLKAKEGRGEDGENSGPS